MTTPTPYMNEDGDWWVRVDQARTQEEARAVVEAHCEYVVTYEGIQTVVLWEGEVGDSRLPHRRRRAHHFRDTEEVA